MPFAAHMCVMSFWFLLQNMFKHVQKECRTIHTQDKWCEDLLIITPLSIATNLDFGLNFTKFIFCTTGPVSPKKSEQATKFTKFRISCPVFNIFYRIIIRRFPIIFWCLYFVLSSFLKQLFMFSLHNSQRHVEPLLVQETYIIYEYKILWYLLLKRLAQPDSLFHCGSHWPVWKSSF